jgi:hypothetical protein
VAKLQWSIGTTVLETTEDIPRGEAAREALRTLLLGGALFSDVVARARDEVEAFTLRAALTHGKGISFEQWLLERLERIGFGSGEDLPLLRPEDLEPGLLSAEQRTEIDRDFPRSLAIGGLGLKVSYDPAKLRVTLRASTAGAPPPRVDLLPRWPGWAVAYHDGRHEVLLRHG